MSGRIHLTGCRGSSDYIDRNIKIYAYIYILCYEAVVDITETNISTVYLAMVLILMM